VHKTHVRPIRDVRNNYAELDRIVNNHDHVIITNNGRGAAVLIGISEYEEYEKFLHKQYIKRKLAEAEASASNPDTKWLSEDEFWNSVEALL
jgi:prevent-host-death family protein